MSRRKSPLACNNGETLGQIAAAGVGVTRVGRFSVVDAIAEGRLVPLLEEYNAGDVELIHAVFVGGTAVPARVKAFVDFLADRLRYVRPFDGGVSSTNMFAAGLCIERPPEK